uniref:Uncharacterized protein n=1 Tax=Lepeophtheirus salmonis TaxID=72036 RepID=A0A0K2USW4_LEPSM
MGQHQGRKGSKSGLSTLTRFFPPPFLIALWTIWCETPRSLIWTLVDLRGLTWGVIFNTCGSSLVL